MREMKDSGIEWIGKIPKGWSVCRVKNFYYTHKDIVGEKSDVYDRLALTLNGVVKRSKDDSVGLQPEAFNGYQILRSNELVFKLIDLANISTSRVGLSAYKGIVSPAYIILSPKTDFCQKFAEYYFLSMWQREVFNHLGDDGVRSSLNASDLLNTPFIYPPLTEQKKIVDYLNDKCTEIEAVLEKTRASIDEYKKLKQSVITQAVTKGIRGDRPMKDSGIEWIGEIPKSWGINTIFQLCTQVKNKNVGLIENNLLSLSYGKIKRKNIDAVEGLLPESFDGYNIIEKDDIVLRLTDLQNDHTSLRVGISEERGIITSAYLTIRNRSNFVPKYLYYYLHSFDISKGFYGMGAGVRQSLNWDGLKWLKVITPSREEQEQIAEFLNTKCTEIDNLISKKEQYITEIENYKNHSFMSMQLARRNVLQWFRMRKFPMLIHISPLRCMLPVLVLLRPF